MGRDELVPPPIYPPVATSGICALFHPSLRVLNRAVGPWVSVAGREAILARGNPAQTTEME
jgi:hypothetical protein